MSRRRLRGQHVSRADKARRVEEALGRVRVTLVCDQCQKPIDFSCGCYGKKALRQEEYRDELGRQCVRRVTP